MMDALDALRMMRMQNLRTPVSRSVKAPAPSVLFGKSNLTPKPALLNDLFQKAEQPIPGPVAKGGRIVGTKIPFLEKPAPSGGLGGLFQTLKSNWLPPVTPAPAQQPSQAFQEAAKRVNPAANPFKTMEAILLAKTEDLAGAQNPALRTQSLNGTKPDLSKKPIGSLTAIALPFAGVGLLAAPVLGPTALVVNPALLNPVVNQLPILIP